MKAIIVALLFMFTSFAVIPSEGNQLNPFESDGCSMVPDAEPFSGNDWLRCCIPHDINYWKGGTEADKEKTDLEFKSCLEKNKMGSWLSRIFYYGVSLGGASGLGTTWRWGYGWSKTRPYSSLSKEELEQVNEYRESMRLPIFLRNQEMVERVVDAVTTKNTCKKDIAKRVTEFMSFKMDPKELKIHKIESQTGDRYQVFSSECKGGYIVVDFFPTLSADLCTFSDYYYYKVERIKSMQVFGSCQQFMKN